MIVKRYCFTGILLLSLCAAGPTLAYDYTLILKNGSNPDCNIVTDVLSDVVINNRRTVLLSQFDEDNGVYTYQWSDPLPSKVAIQVRLVGPRVPNVMTDAGCVYEPAFDSSHTTFTQQYLGPDPIMADTCTCTSSWDE